MFDIKTNGFIDRLNKEGVSGITYVLKGDEINIIGIKTLEQLNSARELILYFIQIRHLTIKYSDGRYSCSVIFDMISENDVVSRICKPITIFTECSADIDPKKNYH